MSAFNDPRYLAASGVVATLPVVIEDDRPCPGCGYNLIGLTIGGACPECGRAIVSAHRKGLDDTFIDAPSAYLRRTTYALWAAFVGLAANVLGLFTVVSIVAINGVLRFYRLGGQNTVWGVNWQIRTPGNALMGGVFLFGSALWLAGLVIATLPRPTPVGVSESRQKEWRRLRYGVWATQAGWALSAAGVLVLAMFSPASGQGGTMPTWVGVVSIVSSLAVLTGVVGLMPTAILLARYADWIPDTELGWRMRTCAWSIGVFGGLLLLTGITPPGLPSFAGIIPFFLWMSVGVVWVLFLGGLLVLFWSIAQMAGAAWASIGNQRQRHERDRRMLERMRKERADQEARYARVPHKPEASPGVRKVGVRRNGPEREGR